MRNEWLYPGLSGFAIFFGVKISIGIFNNGNSSSLACQEGTSKAKGNQKPFWVKDHWVEFY